MRKNKGHIVGIFPGFYQPHGGTKVEIDGVEVQELVDVKFEHSATGDRLSKLTIVLFPKHVEINGEVAEIKVLRPVPEIGILEEQ